MGAKAITGDGQRGIRTCHQVIMVLAGCFRLFGKSCMFVLICSFVNNNILMQLVYSKAQVHSSRYVV